MPEPFLDFRFFRYALLAAEHRSFRRAASVLNVQQSSVSKGVRTLEHWIGGPLFERSHAGVRPTPAGERFLREATLGFDHLERAMQRIGEAQRGEYGELAVAASIPFVMLGDVIESFRRTQPGVSLEMVDGTCSENLLNISQRRADIAFITKAASDGLVQSLRVREERMVAVLPVWHRLAKLPAVALDELRAEKLIFSAQGIGPEVGAHVEGQLRETGGPVDLKFHQVGLCNLTNMVARGLGVTVGIGGLPSALPEDVVLIPLSNRNTIAIHAVWIGANPNPALKSLLQLVRRTSSQRETNSE